MSDEKNNNKIADDVVFEETEEAGKGALLRIKELKEKLKTCMKERQEYLDGWQRAKADFINAQKHSEKEQANFVRFSTRELIKELLPALDSFHIAFTNKEAWEKVDLNWRLGVQYIYTQLLNVLQKNGVALLDPKVGEAFDAVRHASVGTIAVSGKSEDHTVREVIQKGYLLHGKVVQPAKVKIGEFADPRSE